MTNRIKTVQPAHSLIKASGVAYGSRLGNM